MHSCTNPADIRDAATLRHRTKRVLGSRKPASQDRLADYTADLARMIKRRLNSYPSAAEFQEYLEQLSTAIADAARREIRREEFLKRLTVTARRPIGGSNIRPHQALKRVVAGAEDIIASGIPADDRHFEVPEGMETEEDDGYVWIAVPEMVLRSDRGRASTPDVKEEEERLLDSQHQLERANPRRTGVDLVI